MALKQPEFYILKNLFELKGTSKFSIRTSHSMKTTYLFLHFYLKQQKQKRIRLNYLSSIYS